MNINEFISLFKDKQIKYSEISSILNKQLQLKNNLLQLYKNYLDRFSFKIFVKYFILGIADKKCKKCGKLLSYRQIKDNRNYCSNMCSNSDQEVKNKIKNTNLYKYGVDIPAKSSYIKNKMKETNLHKYGVQWYPQINKKQQNDNSRCESSCQKKDQNIFYQQNLFNQSLFVDRTVNNRNVVKQIYSFITNNMTDKFDCVCNHTIQNKVFDVYCHSKQFAVKIIKTIHSESNQLSARSINVKLLDWCQSRNIRIIFVLQDEWIYKQKFVQDRIKSILGIYNCRIYARNCVVKDINHYLCNYFLNQNHIQGKDLSKIKLGLFYNNKLISVMTFGKPRFNQSYQWQLIRFSSKLGYQVIGGASKLLKYFQRKYNPKNLISYADRRYSNGKLYYALGFQFLINSFPNYWWCRGGKKLTRYQCQKHRLKKILGQNFIPQLSQNKNMMINGYSKVYDCGNIVFVKKYF